MPGYDAIPGVLKWLSWFTPASYAFEGIMLNEFVGQNLSIVVLTTPEGSTEAGDMSGEQWLDCMSLPRKNFASYQEMKEFDVFMLFFLAAIFDFLGCYYTERRRGATVVPLVEDRAVLYREATSGMYSRMSNGLGQLAADIPFHALNTLVMFAMFYFQVDFQRQGELMGYFLLMLFLSNWVVMSLGQLFAYATPNEESANGLAGLSVILSVILMGFLIMESAMPSYWTWAYWANLFHYIIQGLVTNELVDNEYTLLSPSAIELPNSGTATSAVLFEPGTDLSTNSTAIQLSNFMSLATQARDRGPGLQYDWENSGIVAVGALVSCMVANNCLVEPLLENFVECCVFKLIGEPPCRDEFSRAVEAVDVDEITKCVQDDTPLVNDDTSVYNVTTPGLTNGFPKAFESANRDGKRDMILCLVRALLPPGFLEDVVESLVDLFKKLYGIVMAILDVIENGVALPGEVILLVFGWAEMRDGQLEAPFKWYYCLFAVGMFLAAIELFKLIAVRFIVWTKR